jgi:hypothetical protein
MVSIFYNFYQTKESLNTPGVSPFAGFQRLITILVEATFCCGIGGLTSKMSDY